MMKKKFFILAVAAAALASCSSDEVVSQNTTLNEPQQKEIAFQALARPSTRGQYAITTTVFPNDNTMEVKAYQTQPSAAAYFDKCTFSKSGSYWKGGQYWPLSAAKINFFAVSGYGVTASNITIADALASAGVAYTTENSYSATTQSDIMYAFGRGEVEKDGNALNFPDKVNMAFKHALALVDFEVKGNSATETSAIKVNSITLKGATYNGTLTLTNTNADTESGVVSTAVSWAAGSSVASVAVPGISASTAITNSYTRIGNGLMVIPGTGFTSFVINYSLNGNNYDYEYTPSPAVSSTSAAYKYTYQINFTLHEIEIYPTVSNWAVDNTIVDIPEIAYEASGTSVVNVPNTVGTYKFTVTGVPAGTYTVHQDVTGDDIITGQAITNPAGGTLAAAGTLTISVTVKENTSGITKTKGVKLHNGTSDVMTFTITQTAP